ncbi:hypothetical protein SAMN05428945_6002 [Streptomyces sp. 2224.1]|nr:hypothetical protein SAMN05428945_6002 [Streptomyces sp. 2224.1]
MRMNQPPRPVDIGGYPLPADQPVAISYAARNNGPALGAHRSVGHRAHLAWGAGQHHRCPVHLAAEAAILHLLDVLPGRDLVSHRDDLVRRLGPFQGSLTALPVIFPAS